MPGILTQRYQKEGDGGTPCITNGIQEEMLRFKNGSPEMMVIFQTWKYGNVLVGVGARCFIACVPNLISMNVDCILHIKESKDGIVRKTLDDGSRSREGMVKMEEIVKVKEVIREETNTASSETDTQTVTNAQIVAGIKPEIVKEEDAFFETRLKESSAMEIKTVVEKLAEQKSIHGETVSEDEKTGGMCTNREILTSAPISALVPVPIPEPESELTAGLGPTPVYAPGPASSAPMAQAPVSLVAGGIDLEQKFSPRVSNGVISLIASAVALRMIAARDAERNSPMSWLGSRHRSSCATCCKNGLDTLARRYPSSSTEYSLACLEGGITEMLTFLAGTIHLYESEVVQATSFFFDICNHSDCVAFSLIRADLRLVFLVCVIIAHKFNSDCAYSSSVFSKYFKVHIQSITRAEEVALLFLDFNLSVAIDVKKYQQFVNFLQNSSVRKLQ